MAQTYTLDEAAQRLGVPLDEFKRRIKDDWKTLRSFRDGATLRFRASDIDELARSMGEASDPGLQLGTPARPMQPGSSEEFLLAPEDMTPTDDSDDIFSVAAGDSGKTKKQKSASDSDVRLEPDSGVKRKSDGIKKSGKSSNRNKDLGNLTEEIDLDMLAGPKSGVLRSGESSAKLKAPKSGPNLAGPGSANRIPGPPPTDDVMGGDSSSEFELSLDTDSDSFELQLNNDQSEEIDLGGPPPSRAGQSGINLGNPKDSGVSLEKKGKGKPSAKDSAVGKAKKPVPPPPAHDDSDDFELSIDSDSSELEASSSPLESSPIGKSSSRDDSDSEFELSLDDAGSSEIEVEQKGDIFETDFSLPPVQDDAESGSEVVAVESSDTDLENSDFDLALDESDIQAADDESASQVVLLDDDSGPAEVPAKKGRGAAGAAAVAAAKKKKKVAVDDDVEEVETADDEDDASNALAGVRRRPDDDEVDVPTSYAPAAKWPGWIIAPLALTFLFTFLGGVMSYELLRGMWGYHQGQTATGGLANTVAGALGMEPDKPK